MTTNDEQDKKDLDYLLAFTSRDAFRTGDKPLLGSNRNTIPEVIYLNPYFLERIAADDFNRITPELITKCAPPHDGRERLTYFYLRLKRKIKKEGIMPTPFDALTMAALDVTLHHEVRLEDRGTEFIRGLGKK
jgi:hypothetical protein